jgi:proteic killer suppression protein
MIKSFQDRDLEIFWESQGQNSPKTIPANLRSTIYRKLREIHRVKDERDLRNVPGNHYEIIKHGKYLNYQSIRINQQYRLLFIWQNNQAYELVINKHDKDY